MAITLEQATAAVDGDCLACRGTDGDHAPACALAGDLGVADGTERCAGPCGQVLEPLEPYAVVDVDHELRGLPRGEVRCLPCAAITPTPREDETP